MPSAGLASVAGVKKGLDKWDEPYGCIPWFSPTASLLATPQTNTFDMLGEAYLHGSVVDFRTPACTETQSVSLQVPGCG